MALRQKEFGPNRVTTKRGTPRWLKWAVAGVLAMFAGQLLFTHTPVMNRLFHSAPISGASWLRILGVAATVFVVVEVEKWFRHGRRRSDHATTA